MYPQIFGWLDRAKIRPEKFQILQTVPLFKLQALSHINENVIYPFSYVDHELLANPNFFVHIFHTLLSIASNTLKVPAPKILKFLQNFNSKETEEFFNGNKFVPKHFAGMP